MTFALVLACTVAACFALRNPLKACPMAFYAAALLVDVAFVAGTFWGMPRGVCSSSLSRNACCRWLCSSW